MEVAIINPCLDGWETAGAKYLGADYDAVYSVVFQSPQPFDNT